MISKSSRILVVDDFDLVRGMMRKILLGLGYHNILEASHGGEAIEALATGMEKSEPIEIVFLDWNMPVKSGIEVLRHCRSSEVLKKLPIVMVTAESERKQVLQALSEGANDYVVKPFDALIIEKKIDGINRRVGKTG